MAPTIRSGSLVVINHTINKVIGSGVYLVQVGETKELRRIQPLVDGTLDIRIDNPKLCERNRHRRQDRHSRQGALHGFREAHPLSSDQNKGPPFRRPFFFVPDQIAIERRSDEDITGRLERVGKCRSTLFHTHYP